MKTRGCKSFAGSNPVPSATLNMEKAINIIVSDENHFIEIENDEGKSISIGEWIHGDEKSSYFKIRITLDDILKL